MHSLSGVHFVSTIAESSIFHASKHLSDFSEQAKLPSYIPSLISDDD